MKSVGIPYMGSKRKIAKDIVKLIRERHPDAATFYDVFGGGGAVSFEASKVFDKVIYNEIKPSMVALMEQLRVGIPNDWYRVVSREEFLEMRNGDTAFDGLVQTCWSFGNNPDKGYIYGMQIEPVKLSAHDFIVKNTKPSSIAFSDKCGVCFDVFDDNCSYSDRKKIIKKRLGVRFDLQSLENINRLPKSIPSNMVTSNLSYESILFDDNSVIYCDPPYAGVSKYGDSFDSDKFKDWCCNLNTPTYISEYDMGDRFTEIWNKDRQCLMQSGVNSNKVTEKLYFICKTQ